MTFLSQFIKYEILLLLAGFAIVVIFQVFNGRISLQQILLDKKTQVLSPARIQQLLFTLIISFYYLYQTLKDPTVFPEIDKSLLYLFSASSFVYLGGKARSIGWLISKLFNRK